MQPQSLSSGQVSRFRHWRQNLLINSRSGATVSHLRAAEKEASHPGRSPQSRRKLLWLASVIAMRPAQSSAEEDSAVYDRGSEATSTSGQPDTTVTDKVYLDVGLCQQGIQASRTLGDNAFCSNPESLGRIVIGLYGRQAPQTVQNFLTLIKNGSYNSTLFNKVLPGNYVVAGKQGSPRMGEVAVSSMLPPNEDLLLSKSYSLEHQRAGTVSLNLSHNDDDPFIQNSRSYRNVSFLITTEQIALLTFLHGHLHLAHKSVTYIGPGPASSLDGTNVVFGKVLQGMDTIGRLTSVPTFKPVNDRLLALNRLGSMLGDDRAEKTRRKWGKPLKPIVITDTGIVSSI